ncbi:PAS domain-containing sensor histidine kinase [Halovenus rubra]|uniref:histidine kinase n=2 Tax=Halovenus rubra TaxID=869890 RepID=A0ABD5X805_9EURY|nr:PAS domain-containing sensor histidine kinase [Halovenus rubra]
MTVRQGSFDEPGPDSEATRILPLLTGDGDQRLLVNWVESHEVYTLVSPDEQVSSADFDCCILDGDALKTHGETLRERERKREAESVLLPCLLLLPEADISVISTDQGEIADGVVFETVDEVVSMPIKKAELEWRTKALLRLRSQSLKLDRKQQQLRKFKQAADAAGHAIYITALDGTIEYVNHAFEEMTGYASSEALGETPQMLDSGEMSPAYFDRLWDTISGGEVWKEEIINQRKDNSVYHAFQTIAPVMNEHGEPIKFVALQSDITQRVEAEHRLERFKDIVERVGDPIMLQDCDGRFCLVNEALVEYTGHTKQELLGKTEYAFMDEESAARIEARKQQVLTQEHAVQYTISPSFSTVESATFSTIRYPYYGEEGTIEGTIAICRDITGLQTRENQLQVIDRVLRHNLRNNMTTIGMFAEKIAAANSGETATDAERIHATSQRINRTVEKERKITKFLTEQPGERTVDLVTIVESVCGRISDKYPAANISCDLPDACAVHATSTLEQAFIELLENAVVHSDKKEPSVEVQLLANSGNSTLHVADDGPGIPEMDRKVLTHGTAIEQLYHGSGLGLWLAHLIVTYSDGTVTFSENEPRGSVVTIQFLS